MKNNKKTPEIRFKGFTDDWEQRKLEDFGSFTGGTSIESEFEENGKYKVISIGSYSETSKYNDQGIRCILSEKTVNKILNKDDFTMILNDKTASGNIIGRVLIIDKSGEYVYNQRTERIEPNIQEYYPQFLYHMLNAPNIRKKIIKQSQGNTQIFVNWTGIQKLEYLVPKMNEQINLAKLIGNLDNLITLHQRKYEKLKNIKQSLLEKMFPKNCMKIPEIRFKGFTDDWEQRKLDDVITRISTGLNPRDNFVLNNGGYNYYVTIKNFTHGNLKLDSNCDMIDNHAMSIIQKRSDLKKDDILFSSIGRIGDCYLLRNTPKNWNINESVFTFRPNKEIVYPEYLFHTIHSDYVLNQILDNVTGSTFKSIKIGDLKKVNISITNKEEQIQLSKFISNIDNLITLHQRKYEKLKNIKQALLDKMFV